MYGHGLNMADVLVRPQPSLQSLQAHSSRYSTDTKKTHESTSALKEIAVIDFAKSRAQEKPQIVYLHGVRFNVLTFAYVCLFPPLESGQKLISRSLCLALFLSTLEISIVSTALVSISDDLQGFHKDSWIVTSYLVTYTG